jgi:MGT family glycosyltransferase
MLHAAETLAPFMLDELGREPCDLVVFDSLAVWGKIAARSLHRKAAATISHFVFDLRSMGLRPGEYLTMMGQFFSQAPRLLRARRRLMQRFGAAYPSEQPLFPMRDRLNIVFTTRDLQPNSSVIDDTFRFVGPSINPQVRKSDFPFESLQDKTIVYLSLGTVHTDTAFYRACFEAFAGHPAQFILSVGSQTKTEELGRIPGNFAVRPFVPQLELLQRAQVFITHGGINSVHEGLYYGVPLILIPHQFEQLLNARRVAARGAGLVMEDRLQGKPITAARLREALQTVLAESRYRAAARDIQQSLRVTGGYVEAADQIQVYLLR